MVSYLATVMLAISVLASAPQGIEWQSDYGDALAETRSNVEPLLVVLDMPQSADARIEPALLSEGLGDPEATEQLKGYNLCHVDVSTKYGKKLASVFKATSFPHVAIIDKSGSVVIFKNSGKMSKSEWTTTLASYRNGDRRAARRISYKLNGDAAEGTTPAYRNNSYCPSCQRNSF